MGKRLISWLLCFAVCLSFLGTNVFVVSAAEDPCHAETKLAVKAASVPTISAPFTTHPTVFIVEDDYHIAFATNTTGLAWVEVGGEKYVDASAGLMNWNSNYHKITVPQGVMNAFTEPLCNLLRGRWNGFGNCDSI